MRKTALSIALAAGLLGPSLASAQASVEFRVELPVVLPRLVVISPGVQVVPEVDEEVFFSDGYYWVRRDNGWYRSRSHRSGWVLVGPRYVPARLVQLPPGKYRRWRPGPPAPAAYREDRKERHERWREDRKERREEMREDRKEEHEREKERRKRGKHGD